MFIDSHTHLYSKDFEADFQEVMEQILRSDVRLMVIPGVDVHSIEPIQKLCETYPQYCFPAIGLHPTEVKSDFGEQLQTIRQHLNRSHYYAIGETGLDYYWDTTFKAEQIKAFRAQIDFAIEFQRPLIVHSRDAFEDTLSILSEYKEHAISGVIHCFSGTVEQAQKAVQSGFYLGIGGGVTFKNSKLPDVVANIDLQHLLLETDAPFIAPHPYRGTRNDSRYIPLIAQRIADIKHVSIDIVAEQTTQNALQLFNLPQPI
ncbi:TatD family hydrolase [Bacteroidia bacterium]|nr:TatD family hydrolase [Bacteroidia bacterium]